VNKLLVVGAVVAGVMSVGCTKKRVAECDDFVATIDKIASCSKLDEKARGEIAKSSKQIKDALKMIDDAGGVGNAPADHVQPLRDTCKTQQKTVVDEYMKLAPDCFK
jgi:hypothetical protein